MSRFFFTMQLLHNGADPAGQPVGLESPHPRGVEALRWRCQCGGRPFDPGRVESRPVWLEDGAPFVEVLELATPDGGEVVELNLRHLYAAEAQRAADRLVRDKTLEAGETYDYRIAAHGRGDGPPPPVDLLHYEVRENGDPPSARRRCDPERAAAQDFEVILEEEVVAKAVAMARRAGDSEDGGFLFGHLLRAAQSGPRPYLHVTALVPAEEGRGAQASFQFVPESWNRGRAALEARGRGEIFVGWSHNHPDLCSPECPEEKRKQCALRRPFFSAADRLLHESVFAAPFNIALLVSSDGQSLTPTLWGWRDGLIVRRSYSIHTPS